MSLKKFHESHLIFSSCNPDLPDDELDREEYDDKVVDHLDDQHHRRILNIASRILIMRHMTPDTRHHRQKSHLLQLICSGDNEGDG